MINSDYIALCSGFVALLALFVSVWQGYITRKHNILSVRPHVEITYNSLFDDYSVEISNNGLGAAIVKEVVLSFDGKTCLMNDESNIKVFLNYLFGDFQTIIKYHSSDNTFSLAPNEKQLLFRFQPPPDVDLTSYNHHFNKARIRSKELSVKVTYECMYGKLYTVDQ
jgi:hypothetical protein